MSGSLWARLVSARFYGVKAKSALGGWCPRDTPLMLRLPPPWLAPLVPFERSIVEVEDRRIHVMETGTGPHPVVMLHGNPTWGFLWRSFGGGQIKSHLAAVLRSTCGGRRSATG